MTKINKHFGKSAALAAAALFVAQTAIAAAVMALAATAANAATYQSFLEYSDAFASNLTSNTPPYFGEVTLTEGGSGTGAYVDVHVDLFSGLNFVNTGNDGQHTSFVLNLTNPGTARITSIAPNPPWTVSNPLATDNSPFGTFNIGLTCCTSNGGPGVTPPLDFRVTDASGITFLGVGGTFIGGVITFGSGDHFNSNSTGGLGGVGPGGWWFAADVIGNGVTGEVAARDLVSSIPEPETYAMMLAGLGLMGFVARRRKGRASI